MYRIDICELENGTTLWNIVRQKGWTKTTMVVTFKDQKHPIYMKKCLWENIKSFITDYEVNDAFHFYIYTDTEEKKNRIIMYCTFL